MKETREQLSSLALNIICEGVFNEKETCNIVKFVNCDCYIG